MVRLLVGFEYLQIAFIGDIKMPGFEFVTRSTQHAYSLM